MTERLKRKIESQKCIGLKSLFIERIRKYILNKTNAKDGTPVKSLPV